MSEEMKPCPGCGGEIKLMGGLLRVPEAYAKCIDCNKEYDLPNVKIKTWPSNPIRISKTTIRQAVKSWNKLAESETLRQQSSGSECEHKI
ncbi:MAG: hypothetical protein J1E01_01245 [Acetatifactor sp.]|nr:hypothetical protein [Acetatifactor sp.]